MVRSDDNNVVVEQTQQLPSGEYFTGSYTVGGVDDPSVANAVSTVEAPPEASEEDLEKLAKGLGIDISKLRETLGQETPSTETPKEETKPEDENKEEVEKRLRRVDNEVKELLGVGLTEVYGLLNELNEFKAQYVLEKQQSVLKQEWGEGYQDALSEVRAYWDTLPETQQKALDNVDGARLIYALVQQNKRQPNASSKQTYVNSSARGSSNGRPTLRMSDIVKLSESEYFSRQDEIQDAFRRGLVLNDV